MTTDNAPHILAIDDDPAMRELIADYLGENDVRVTTVATGEEMARVVAELLDSSNPFACPHGRPIIVDIKHLDIERHFHRK